VKATSSNAKRKILLVEDNPGDARLLREALSDAGGPSFELEHVNDLSLAVERLSRGGIDLVLLDLSLPDSFGLETFAKTHAAAPEVPMIVLSGQDDESLAIQTVHEGAQDYLVKGQVDGRLLVRSIRYAIERNRSEEALAKERDLLHTLLDNLPDRIYFKDEQSRFLRINRAVAEQFKLRHPREAAGKSDLDFFTAEHAQAALKDEQQVMQTGQPILGKVEKETLPDGSVTWALTSKMPLKDKQGKVIGNFGISRDITALKKIEYELAAERNLLRQANAEQARSRAELEKVLADLQKSHEELKTAQFQLIQAEKMQSVGRLAAGVAHEVKNPLATLSMGIDYLKKNLASPDANVGLILGDMHEALKRADLIIHGLLDFSVPRALDLHAEDLSALVEHSLGLVRHEMSDLPIKLVKELAEKMPPAWIDKNKVIQVLVNVLTNAIHSMPDGGTLTVRTYSKQLQGGEIDRDAGSRLADRFRTGETVVATEVIDTGAGISQEELSKIYDPFFTTKPTGKGTGLGLTVTKKIVELHGGSIDIRNRPEGGVIVTILFKV